MQKQSHSRVILKPLPPNFFDPKPNCESTEEKAGQNQTHQKEHEVLKGPPGKLLRISFKPDRPITEADIHDLRYGYELYKLNLKQFKSVAPNLDGTNNKPLIEADFIVYYALRYKDEGPVQAFKLMLRDLHRISTNIFVPEPDMHVEWIDPEVAKPALDRL